MQHPLEATILLTPARLKSPDRLQRLASLAVVAAVLAAVLVPQPGEGAAVSFCVACGERGVADALRNLLLFIPVGMAAAGWYRASAAAVIACAAMSLGVEVAQLWIPGRDPALGDLLFNTLGAAAGVALARSRAAWLRPHRRAAGRLSLAWAAVVWIAVAATGVLLAPPAGSQRSVMGTRSGDDVVLHVYTRAARIGLDQPVVRWRDAYAETAADVADPPTAVRDRGTWCARAGPRRRCGLGATAGGGWSVLAYPDALAARFGALADAAWVGLLFLPLGFWFRRGWISAIAAASALGALAVIPMGGMLASTPALEWAGTGAGMVAGAALARLARPAAGGKGQ